MPFDRFVLIMICVLAAAVVTVYVGLLLVARTQLPTFLEVGVFSVVAMGACLSWRFLPARFGQRADDRSDDPEN